MKMDYKKRILDDSELGNKIISWLRDQAKEKSFLDKRDVCREGDVIIAGAAVMTAVANLLKIDWLAHTKLNDIDLFISNETMNMYNTNFSKKVITSDNSVVSVAADAYGHLSIQNISTYSVVISRREGMFNHVFIEDNDLGWHKILKRLDENKIAKIVNQFDFNSTQIGVDLATGKLWASDNFIKFLETKELDIANLNTPIHTLFRIFKKRDDMQGTIVDTDRLAKICTFGYISSKRMYDRIPLNFGETTLKKFLMYQNEIEKYGVLFKEKSEYGSYQTYVFEPKSKHFSNINQLNDLYLTTDFDVNQINCGIPNKEIIKMIDFAYNGSTKDKLFFQKVLNFLSKTTKEKDAIHRMKYLMTIRPTFFTNVRSQDYRTFKKMFDFIKENNVHYFAVKNLDYAARLNGMYEKLTKEYEPSVINTLFEGTYYESSPSKIEKEFKKEILNLKKDINEKINLFESYEDGNISIEVIRNQYDLIQIGKKTGHYIGFHLWKMREGKRVVLKITINEKIIACIVNLTEGNTYNIESFEFKVDEDIDCKDDIISGESVLKPMSINDFVLMMKNVTSLKYKEKDSWPENTKYNLTKEKEVDDIPF